MNLRVDGQHDGRVVGRRIRVRKAAAQCAAVAHLRIADLPGGVSHHGHFSRSKVDVATS